MNNHLFTQMVYRIVLCVLSALAVALTVNFFYFGEGASELSWDFLKFYTNISNYFVFVVSVIVTADTVRRVKAGEQYGYNKKIRKLKFYTTVMILVTFLVYCCLLGKPFTLDFWRSLGNVVKHVAVPILFILDFFLFDEHKSLSVFDPLLSFVIPLVYVGYVLVLGLLIDGFEYPYFFLNVDNLGYGGVAVWVLILLVVFGVLGCLMWLYDKLVKIDGKWKLDFSRTPKGERADEGNVPPSED